MVSKKYMIWSIIVTLICLGLGITCAVYRPDTLSYVLLGVVIFFAVLISISVFIEIVAQNKDAKKLAADKEESSDEAPVEVSEEAPVESVEEVVETEEVPAETEEVEETSVEEVPAEEVSIEEVPTEEIVADDDKKSDEE